MSDISNSITINANVASVSNSDGSITISPTTGAVVSSLNVAHGNIFTIAQTFSPTQAANTYIDGIVLSDTTVASSGNQQYSPSLRLTGQGWKTNATAASQTVDWLAYNAPVQGTANPSTQLTFAAQVNGGGYIPIANFGSDYSLNFPNTGNISSINFSRDANFTFPDSRTVAFVGGGNGSKFEIKPNGQTLFVWNSTKFLNASQNLIGWTNDNAQADSSLDTAITRNASGVVEINNGTAGIYGDLNVQNIFPTGKINSSSAQTTLNGTTAGTIVWSEPLQGTSLKLFIGYASGYENNTVGNQTIGFTTAFANVPVIIANNTGLMLSVSTTTLTITAPNNTSTFTGNILIMGA